MLWLKNGSGLSNHPLNEHGTPMNDLEELIERTRWMQEQVKVLQQTIERLQCDHHPGRNTPEEQITDADGRAALAGAPIQTGNVASGSADASFSEAANKEDQERRALPRRRGHPVAVLIARSDVPGSPSHGWVVDRSPEGLCVVSEEAIPVSSWIRVRSTDHPRGSEWFEVEVRNCRPERNVWILGCQFRSALSWSELRQLS
jgi:PilZ domain